MFTIDDILIIRSPNLPFNDELNISDDNIIKVKNAIYYSGYDILNQPISSDLFYKYLSRMSSRPTPFGLFSSIGATTFGENRILVRGNINYFLKHDTFFQARILKYIDQKIDISKRKIYLNTTLFKFGRQFRYTYISDNLKTREFSIKQVSNSEPFKLIVNHCKAGCDYKLILEIFIKHDFNVSQVNEYLLLLYKEQIIFTDLEIDIIESKTIFSKIKIAKIPVLKDYQNKEKELPETLTLNEYKVQLLNQNIDPGNNLYNITSCISTNGTLDIKYKGYLKRGLDKLIKILEPNECLSLKEFKKEFKNKYENKTILLLEALDPSIGIGYDNNHLNDSLVKNVKNDDFKEEKNFNLSSLQFKILRKIQENKLNSDVNISSLIKNRNDLRLPKTFSVLFKIIGNNEIYMESVGGSSALNLLSRFNDSNTEIELLCKKIVEFEKESEIIDAQIVYSPDYNTQNILIHKKVYDYEIPILTKPSEAATTISLSDLYLQINNSELILYSKKLKKRVIPKISNSHNFNLDSFYLYKFLCELQGQNQLNNLNIDFYPILKLLKNIPRITIDDIILYPKSWIFDKDEISFFEKKLFGSRYFIYKYFDNELLFDLQNVDTIEIIRNKIKNKEEFIISEYLYDKSSGIITDNMGNKFVNQFIATVYNHKKEIHSKIEEIKKVEFNNARKFTPGSQWVYFKIFSTVYESNYILHKVHPLINKLIKAGIVEKWFFVRYFENGPNLRLRIKLNEKEKFNNVFVEFENFFSNLVKKKHIEFYSIDTYERELERYDIYNINIIEKIFYYDSEFTLKIFRKLKNIESKIVLYVYAMISILGIIDAFEKSIIASLNIIKKLIQNFDSNLNKVEVNELNQIFRENKDYIFDTIKALRKSKLFIERKKELKLIIHEITNKDSDNLIIDLIHMNQNRIFINNQNKNELIVYNFVQKFLKTNINEI